MKRVLLHICCAPCAVYPVRVLRQEGFEVTGLFLNPNIHPASEYIRRRETLREFEDRLGIRVIYRDDAYDPGAWIRAVAFREENRCFHCYSMRMEQTGHVARRGKFDFFTTTLLYSRRQKHELIAQVCRDWAAGNPADFLYRDFREGWKEGIETSKTWGMYRQDYCGCLLSETERRQGEIAPRSGKG